MYLLNINKLKNSIQAGQFTEADRFHYLIVFLLVEAAIYEYVMSLAGPEPQLWDYLSLACSVALLGGGTYAAYLANGGAAGRDFVARYFAINLVVTCRFILVSALPLVLWFYYSLVVLEQTDTFANRAFDLLFTMVWGLLFYYRMYRHMADVKDAPLA